MKKIFFVLVLAAIALAGMAQTVGEAFYIYRNDGQFNAFFRDEVEKMEYSNIDADGVEHDEMVTQLVFTADSVYSIPLAAIDSVGFVKPENVLKANVKNLTGSILEYLIKYEGTCLYFLESTPSELLPSVGEKLATIEMTVIFPCGFFGEVLSVKKEDGLIIVECAGLDLEDVFDSYSCSVDILPAEEGTARISRVPTPNVDRIIHIPTMSHSWSLGFGYSMFNVKNTIEASLTPKFHIRGNDIVDRKRGRLTDIRVTCNYVTETSYEFGFETACDPLDFPFPGGRGEYPICPALSFFWDFGMFVGVSGSVTYSQSFTQEYESCIDYKREGIKMPTISFGHPTTIGGQKSDPRIALKGSIRGGFYGELGIKPWAIDKNALGKVSGRLEIGLEAEMERGIDLGELENADRNTVLYDFVDNVSGLTSNTLTISPYASVDVTVRVGPWNSHWKPWKGKFGSPFYQGGFFPHFSNTNYNRDENGGIRFTSDLSHNCPFPWQIGFSVFDLEGNHIITEFYNETYMNPYDFDTYDVTITGLKQDVEYKTYPTINVFNHPVLASPYVIVRSCPVKLSDFKVTNSQHQERGFTNDGLTYDYRFDVTVTATLEDNSENIIDWGYVYLDPNGREALISLIDYGNEKVDDRWAYFRNGQRPFTCTLYGYVQYAGSDERVYGKPHDYPLVFEDEACTDDNHPHLVNLDLPSGTRWYCTNYGADKPEEWGGYYAFAELSEKRSYSLQNYLYYYYDYQFGGQYSYFENIGGNLQNFGVSISGKRGYDVVTQDWGDEGRMPTKAEAQELIDECTWTWTFRNGVPGYEVTGKNDNSIFLPASGQISQTTSNAGNPSALTVYRTGEWSSRQWGTQGFGYTWGIRFKQDSHELSDACAKAFGCVIRPVKSKE